MPVSLGVGARCSVLGARCSVLGARLYLALSRLYLARLSRRAVLGLASVLGAETKSIDLQIEILLTLNHGRNPPKKWW